MSPFACSVSLQVVSNVFCCRELTRVEHAGLTVLIVAVCTSMSLAFECLGVVLELNVSCCFHWSVDLIDCSWPCSHVMVYPLLYDTGRSECHSSDLHHSICMLPQALPWTVVSGWKPDTVNPDFYRHVCHDHRFDHDWAVPTRLFPRKRNVLLRRLKCVWHRTACMIKTPLSFSILSTDSPENRNQWMHQVQTPLCALYFVLFLFYWICYSRYTLIYWSIMLPSTGRVSYCTFTWVFLLHCSFTVPVTNSNEFWRSLKLFFCDLSCSAVMLHFLDCKKTCCINLYWQGKNVFKNTVQKRWRSAYCLCAFPDFRCKF